MTGFLPGLEPSGRATFSPCQQYRYTPHPTLPRNDGIGMCVFVMLNPSTATAEENDPTVRRCIGYATDWGYHTLTVLNAFAYRATDPREMKHTDDPVGPENDHWLRTITQSEEARRVSIAWGPDGGYLERDLAVMNILTERGIPPFCLGTNLDGTPKHPLYLRKDLTPHEYRGRAAHRVKIG